MIKNPLAPVVFAAWLLGLALAGCNSVEAVARKKALFPFESYSYFPKPEAAAPQPADDANLEIARMWKDPKFQKQFVGTYGTIAELEPHTELDEFKILDRIRPWMGDPNLWARAQAILESQTNDKSSAILDFTLGNLCLQQSQNTRDNPALQQKKMSDALACYKKAVDKWPSFRRAYRNLGVIHTQGGRYDEAITAFTKMISLGFAYTSKQDHQAAEMAYRNALLLDPDNMEWRLNLVRCVYRQRKFEDAAALLDVLLEKDPGSVDNWLTQASAYMGMKQPMKAAQNLEVVERLGKANADTLYWLGDLYGAENLPDLAAGAYCRAIDAEANSLVLVTASQPASDPAPPPASLPATSSSSQPASQPTTQATAQPSPLDRSLRSAEVLAARGAITQAGQVAAHARQRLASRVKEGDLRRLMKVEARLIMAGKAGNAETARILQEIIRIDPMDGEAIMMLGQYYSRPDDPNRDPDQAILTYERAAAIPKFAAAAKIRQAQVLVSMGQHRYPDAVPLLKQALEIEPRNDVATYLDQVERIAKTVVRPGAGTERSGAPRPASGPATREASATRAAGP